MPRALLTAVVLLLPTTGLAQDTARERPVQYLERTILDIAEATEVEGSLHGPEVISIREQKTAQFNPLLRFRVDFQREMHRSIDEVE